MNRFRKKQKQNEDYQKTSKWGNSAFWTYCEETEPMPGEENHTRNGSRQEEERKTSNNLDGKHHPLDDVINKESGMTCSSAHILEETSSWCGQPFDWAWLKARQGLNLEVNGFAWSVMLNHLIGYICEKIMATSPMSGPWSVSYTHLTLPTILRV